MTEKTLSDKLMNSHYQPTKSEMEREYNMPGADMEELTKAFFTPSETGKPKPYKANENVT